MKKLLSILITAVMLLSIFAVTGFALTVDPKCVVQHNGNTTSYATLAEAVDAAKNGDVITLAGEVSSYTTSDGVTITKNITFKTGKDFNGNKKNIKYSGTSAPLFTVAKGATLTITDANIYGNTNSSLKAGGFARVKDGGKLILDGKSGSTVNIKNFKLNANNSKGGAVYCEKGGTVTANGVTFSGNSASVGNDIFAEKKGDVTIKSGVSADFKYSEEKPVEDEPGDNPATDADKCSYCGKVHPNNTMGNLIKYIHVILNFFKNIFG